MTKKLYLALYGQSPFGDYPQYDLLSMLADAGKEGLTDEQKKAIGYISVAGLLTPMLNDQCLLAGLVAMAPPFTGLPITGVGNACDSGGLAVLDATKAVLCGQTHVAMAMGVEKMNVKKDGKRGPKTDSIKIGQMLGTAAHPDDRFPPFTFPHAFALIMAKYMKTHGYGEKDFATLPPYLYTNATHNPLAHCHTTKEPVTPEAVMESYRLFKADADAGYPELPLKLLECSQISDGWARIVVCDEEGLSMLGLSKENVTVLGGWGQAVDGLSIASRGEMLLQPQGAQRAFRQAIKMAEFSAENLGAVEIHDCFAIMLALTPEIFGLAKPGQGLPYFKDHMMGIDSGLPTNTSGGLIAKGHPISATGIAMIGWIHQQLLGQVPKSLQVPGCENGATFNIGGPLCSTVCTVQYRP